MIAVAGRLFEEGSVVLAIELLEAACEEKTLPEEKAKRHLKLSQSLLKYTLNYERAKEHALKAQAAVGLLKGAMELKCEAQWQLGMCCAALGDFKNKAMCYRKGLEMCQKSASPSGIQFASPALLTVMGACCMKERNAWYCCFAVGLFQSLATLGDASEAQEVMKRALDQAKEGDLLQYQMWIPFLLAWQAVMVGDGCQALVDTAEMRYALDRAGVQKQEDLRMAGHFYCALVESTLALQLGNRPVHAKTQIQQSLSASLQLLGSMEEWKDPFNHMSLTEMQAVLLSNAAALDLLKGDSQSTKEHLNQAEMQLSGTPEGRELSEIEAGCLYYVLEIRTRQCLLEGAIQEAQDGIIKIQKRLEYHPALLPRLKSSFHGLIGCYLQAVGLQRLAVTHHRRSIETASSQLRQRATLNTALAEIGTRQKSSATELLRAVQEEHPSVSNSDPVFLYVKGLLHKTQGDLIAARCCLHEAVQYADDSSVVAEIASRVALDLGQLHALEGNTTLAHEMLKKASALSKDCSDIATSFSTQRALLELQGDNDTRQQDQTSAARWTQFKASIQEALKREDIHKRILKWDLKP